MQLFASRSFFENISSIKQINRLQEQFNSAQKEISSGRIGDVPLSLGSSTGKFIRLDAKVRDLESIVSSNNYTISRLAISETSLGSAVSTLENFKSVLIGVKSGAVSSAGVQNSARNTFGSLAGYLNVSFADDYVFSGVSNRSPALLDHFAPGSPSYGVIDDSFKTAFGFPLADASAENTTPARMASWIEDQFVQLFDSPNWERYWSGASANVSSLRFSGNEFGHFGVTASDPALRKIVMSIVMAGTVISDKLDPETLKVVSNIALVKAIEAESEITSLRSNLGSSIRRLEAASEKMTLQIGLARREISDLVEVDPFELSLRVETLRTRLEASLMTTSRLSKLSLVNFM